MTATTKLSKPEKVAREIEALGMGWEVTRHKIDNQRTVLAVRGSTRWAFTWRRDENGVDRYLSGYRGTSNVKDGAEPWFNVAAAIRLMAKPDADLLVSLPEKEALAALCGREITWRNSITGREETGNVPAGGLHLRLGGGILHFTDARGFHSVRLSSIVKVS